MNINLIYLQISNQKIKDQICQQIDLNYLKIVGASRSQHYQKSFSSL